MSNHLHMVEHVVQSKSEKKIFCVLGGGGGGGGGATALMAQSRQRGHNLAKLGPTEKINVFVYFLY